MIRMSEIGDFATKLGVVMERLNWSRGMLAQRVGVDKSVVQRWATGRVLPTEPNLAALTAAIAQGLPDFNRADGCSALPEFTRRFAAGAAAHPLAAIFVSRRGKGTPLWSAPLRVDGFRLLF